MYIKLYFAIDFNLHAFTSFNVSACLISKFHFWLIRALTHWRYWPITTSMTSTVNKYHIQVYINVATLWNYDKKLLCGWAKWTLHHFLTCMWVETRCWNFVHHGSLGCLLLLEGNQLLYPLIWTLILFDCLLEWCSTS